MCLRCTGYAQLDIHLNCVAHSCQVCQHMAQQTSQFFGLYHTASGHSHSGDIEAPTHLFAAGTVAWRVH